MLVAYYLRWVEREKRSYASGKQHLCDLQSNTMDLNNTPAIVLIQSQKFNNSTLTFLSFKNCTIAKAV